MAPATHPHLGTDQSPTPGKSCHLQASCESPLVFTFLPFCPGRKTIKERKMRRVLAGWGLFPQRMFRKALGSHSENATHEDTESQSLELFKQKPDYYQVRPTADATPQGTSIGLANLMSNSHDRILRIPLEKVMVSRVHLCWPGGSGFHNPGSPRMTHTNWAASLFLSDHHLVPSYFQLVCPNPVVILISLKDKLQ